MQLVLRLIVIIAETIYCVRRALIYEVTIQRKFNTR